MFVAFQAVQLSKSLKTGPSSNIILLELYSSHRNAKLLLREPLQEIAADILKLNTQHIVS
jgi:hypothetical protein